MRIHTDTLSRHDVLAAAGALSGVYVYATPHGSRKRDHAFEVALRGSEERHTRRPNSGRYGADSYEYAATYSDWGYFLAALFAADPNLTTTYYSSANGFHSETRRLYQHPATLPYFAEKVRGYIIGGANKTTAIERVAREHLGVDKTWLLRRALDGIL